MPVGLLIGGERPDEIRRTQPAGNMRIADDVLLIVELDKGVLGDGSIKCQRAQREQKTDQREMLAPPGGRSRAWTRGPSGHHRIGR